ncbi:MAG: hypothetical protein H5U03_09115, partial [Clostridia bacterium]|nr:hypothetical protein [Clostridia bacterium]
MLLEADVPPTEVVSKEAMDAARGIIENRVNGLGVAEPLVQAVGGNRIAVELPGIEDPEQAIATFRETGLLEFVDASFTPLQPGLKIKTSYSEAGILGPLPTPTVAVRPTVEITPSATVSATVPITASSGITTSAGVTVTNPLTATQEMTGTGSLTATNPSTSGTEESERIFPTILTGKHLKSA